MKNKIMKYIALAAWIILAVSCHSKDQKANRSSAEDSLSIPENINTVVGIGKVEPQNGVVDLASNTGGIVLSIAHDAGDTLKKGALILTLKQKEAVLNVRQLKDQIATQKEQMESDKIAVNQYKAQLQNKRQTLKISEKLAETGAETRENVASLKTDLQVLKVQLAQSLKAVSVGRTKIKTLNTQLESAENSLQDKTVTAPSDGILLSMDARVGGAVQALSSFATFAPAGPWVVQGEADEMFANRLEKGQEVTIHFIGNAHTITTGKIMYLSPDLSNKSLFSDVPGEKQDRRVRRFKVRLDSSDHLLINSKVECNIHLQKENS